MWRARAKAGQKGHHEHEEGEEAGEALLPSSSPTLTPRGWLSCPPYKLLLCSLTNVLSTFLQYESLHFVSFPLQVLSKSSKVLFTMLMGRVISHQHYPMHSPTSRRCSSQWALSSSATPRPTMTSHRHPARPTPPTWEWRLLVGYMIADSFTSTWQGRIFKRPQARWTSGR